MANLRSAGAAAPKHDFVARKTQLCASARARRGGWRALTLGLRALPAVLFLAHALGLCDLDALVAVAWDAVLESGLCRWTMLEGMVAALSFAAWIVWFRFLDCTVAEQFRLVPRPRLEGLPGPVQDIQKALGSLRALGERHKRTLRVWGSFPIYLGSIWLFHLVKTPPPVETSPPSCLRLVAELFLGIWAYDFVFYWLHLSMHFWPHAGHEHMSHHVLSGGDEQFPHKFLEAEAVVNNSLFDAFLQVLTNIVVQNLPLLGLPKHKLSRLLHNVVVTYLLTESHAGLDLPWGSHRLCPAIFGGAPRHEVHHHLHKCCFHQFFKYFDDLFGLGPPPGTLVGWD